MSDQSALPLARAHQAQVTATRAKAIRDNIDQEERHPAVDVELESKAGPDSTENLDQFQNSPNSFSVTAEDPHIENNIFQIFDRFEEQFGDV